MEGGIREAPREGGGTRDTEASGETCPGPSYHFYGSAQWTERQIRVCFRANFRLVR